MLVAQSGGPTAVINASACGVIQEAHRHTEVAGILGANDGILGVLREDLFDLGAEPAETIEGLRWTPSAAIGSCRYKLGDLKQHADKYARILEVFEAHEVRYFIYIGGNDSMDTADKVNRLAEERGRALRVLGVPKTIDNDLACTDHCPGYGSAAKFLAACAMEAGRDTEAMHTFDAVTILEVMGRNTGWLAAATGLSRREEADAPHLIYVPEIPFRVEAFVEDVRRVLRERHGALVVVSEGLVNEQGEYVASAAGRFATDAFGHRQLGGIADYLCQVVEKEVGVKARFNKLGTTQRNAVHFASGTDNDEAYRCGQEAVRQALAGASGVMVSLVREENRPYRCGMGLAKLSEVANGVKRLPRDFMDRRGTGISEAMRAYAGPLLHGEAPVRIAADGLPAFVRFQRRAIEKRLNPVDFKA